MTESKTIYLIYHELQLPGRELCRQESGYVRYAVTEADFREQLACLRASGFRGMGVSEALDGTDRKQRGVVITFDDGCETDLLSAAPLLREAGFHATFYVVVGFLGRRGYLSAAQLRQLSTQGFEIGCHSMTHAHLSDLGPDGLRDEIVEAKERLEQLLGKPVKHFSCPGGRWNRNVARVAQAAGFRSVATSRIAANSPSTDRFRLARLAVLRGTPLADFERLRGADGLFLPRVRDVALGTAKRMLGNSLYEKVRSVLLGGSAGNANPPN